MNDPGAQPIDIEEQRKWLNDHKRELGTAGSWKSLGARIGISHSTLSLFAADKYNAPGARIAEAIFRYRQTLAAQAAIKIEAPEIPGYFKTETSEKLIMLLQWAHRGRMALAATGAGMGKSITAEYYAACNANVWYVLLSPDVTTINGLLNRILISIGDANSTGRTGYMSQRIMTFLRERSNGLLIVDEAQHGDVKMMDMLRYFHDKTGVGLAIFGNERVQQRIDGIGRTADFAQIFSRVSRRLVRAFPLSSDIDALLDAWEIEDEGARELMHVLGKKPGALRGATFTLETAKMIADSQRSPVLRSHVEAAWVHQTSAGVSA